MGGLPGLPFLGGLPFWEDYHYPLPTFFPKPPVRGGVILTLSACYKLRSDNFPKRCLLYNKYRYKR